MKRPSRFRPWARGQRPMRTLGRNPCPRSLFGQVDQSRFRTRTGSDMPFCSTGRGSDKESWSMSMSSSVESDTMISSRSASAEILDAR